MKQQIDRPHFGLWPPSLWITLCSLDGRPVTPQYTTFQVQVPLAQIQIVITTGRDMELKRSAAIWTGFGSCSHKVVLQNTDLQRRYTIQIQFAFSTRRAGRLYRGLQCNLCSLSPDPQKYRWSVRPWKSSDLSDPRPWDEWHLTSIQCLFWSTSSSSFHSMRSSLPLGLEFPSSGGWRFESRRSGRHLPDCHREDYWPGPQWLDHTVLSSPLKHEVICCSRCFHPCCGCVASWHWQVW